jgi:hypothetical protein
MLTDNFAGGSKKYSNKMNGCCNWVTACSKFVLYSINQNNMLAREREHK